MPDATSLVVVDERVVTLTVPRGTPDALMRSARRGLDIALAALAVAVEAQVPGVTIRVE